MIHALVLAATVSVHQVPKPIPHGWVTDMANVISPASEQQINARLFDLKAATGHEVAVVTVDNVNAASPKAFATELFNLWGIGSKERNDGLLVLLVVGQRRLEMETGIGMESRLPDDWLVAMQQRVMVPKFKQGDFGGGIEAGLLEVDMKLRGTGAHAVAAATPVLPAIDPATGKPYPTPTPVSPYDSQLVRDPVTGNLVPAGINGGAPVNHSAVTTAPPTGGPKDIFSFLAGIFTLVAGGAGSVMGFFWIGKVMRKCPKCKSDTVILDELADDAHLNEAQKTEERIGSVNYKVYVCPGCDFTRTVASNRWFSGYGRCSGCSSRTMKSTSTTLVYATYDHGGTVQVNESCVRCPYRNQYTRSTPRKTRSSSSSSGSRSGGSSVGGGRSRGGGGGSSW